MTSPVSGWASTTIGRICDLVNGKAFKPSDWSQTGLPIVRIQNLNNPDARFNFYDHAIEERFLLNSGDLVFAWSGTPGTSFGAHIWSGGPAVLNQHIFKVEFNRELINAEFLKLAINQTLDEQISKSHGGVGLRHITKSQFEDTEIFIPPLAEQERIVTKIASVEDSSRRARASLEQVPTLVSRYKRSILSAAFNGSWTDEWRARHNIADWVRSTVGDVALAIFDGPFGSNLKTIDYTANGVRVVRLENIGRLKFLAEKTSFISANKYKSLVKHTLKDGDVLFSSFITEEIRCCIYMGEAGELAINKSDCFVVRSDPDRCIPKFLMYKLSSDEAFHALEDEVHGATRQRISLGHLRSYEFDCPSLEEQSEIVRRIENAFGWVDRVAQNAGSASALLAQLDAAILAKAFRGQLVSQDSNDGSAPALLQVILTDREAARSQPRPKIERGKSERTTMKIGIREVLAASNTWISAQEAFRLCGVGQSATTEEIEAIYAELRLLDLAGALLVEPVRDEHGLKLHDRIRLREEA